MNLLETMFVRKITSSLIVVSALFGTGIINAQVPGITNRPKITNTNKVENPGSVTPRIRQTSAAATAVRIIYTPIYKTKETTKVIKPTGLSVTSLPDTEITVEPIPAKGKTKKSAKTDQKGILSFENLQPGKYKLTASLPGFQTQESEIAIVSQKILVVPVSLKRITYDFSIQTNVEEGEIRFAPVQVLEQNPNGTLKVKETGSYCVVPIKNKKATISDLPEGTYNIDVRAPNAPEYQPELAVIEIPADIPNAKSNTDDENEAPFEINLVNTLSTETFNQITVKEAWNLPPNWKIDSSVLKADGAGIALPKSESFRFYKDFEMQATLRLLNNNAAGFLLRAKDEKNYYLVQLSGSKANEPYLISGYLVRDGRQELVVANPITFLAKTIGDQKYFGVIIKAQGDTFDVSVEDTATGNVYPLGKIVFKDNQFPIGAVGLSAIGKSSFEVGRFTVCSPFCK